MEATHMLLSKGMKVAYNKNFLHKTEDISFVMQVLRRSDNCQFGLYTAIVVLLSISIYNDKRHISKYMLLT